MKNKKLIALMWVLSLLPLVMVLAAWPHLPQQVPVQWGLNGQVHYGGRAQLLAIALPSLLLAPLFQFLPHIDPRKDNYEKFRGFYEVFAALIPLFLATVMAVVLLECFRPGSIQVGRFVGTISSLLFLVLGAFVGKVKTNWFMGFRTPWALSDPDVWNKTNRLGGWMFFLTGLVNLPLALLAPEMVSFTVLMAMIGAGVVLTCFMSWWWYRKAHP